MKATYGELIEEEYKFYHPETESDAGELISKIVGREIYKDPKTDDGTKKSARGLLQVFYDEKIEDLALKDRCTWQEEKQGLLETVFLNGELTRSVSLTEVRNRLNAYL